MHDWIGASVRWKANFPAIAAASAAIWIIFQSDLHRNVCQLGCLKARRDGVDFNIRRAIVENRVCFKIVKAFEQSKRQDYMAKVLLLLTNWSWRLVRFCEVYKLSKCLKSERLNLFASG